MDIDRRTFIGLGFSSFAACVAERAAFAAFREKVSRLPSHLADVLGAVDEIRAASERSKRDAQAFMERADALRKQMGKKS